jgi:hypothetical protein
VAAKQESGRAAAEPLPVSGSPITSRPADLRRGGPLMPAKSPSLSSVQCMAAGATLPEDDEFPNPPGRVRKVVRS